VKLVPAARTPEVSLAKMPGRGKRRGKGGRARKDIDQKYSQESRGIRYQCLTTLRQDSF